MKKKNVGIAELETCKAPDALTILGLGSCVAVAMYHEKSKTGSLVHIMLPEGEMKNGVKPGKYANIAVKAMHDKMKKNVGGTGGIVAKIAGGSNMFKVTKRFRIGEQNIKVAKSELKKLGIRIVAQDCGNNYGRSIIFTPEDGNLRIKSLYGEKII
jgi:chemotaxis protein CheD